MRLILKIQHALGVMGLVFYTMAPTKAENLTPPQQAQVRGLQNYLNGLTTLQAIFVQTNPNGTTSPGKMYLKRLGTSSFGKLRLDYDPPSSIEIRANGESLRHLDKGTGEVNEYAIDMTPASFLLRHKIDFFHDLEVKNLQLAANKISLTVRRPGDDGVTLTLIFTASPLLRLQEWQVIDGQANQTHVVLQNVEIGIPLSDNLFAF